MRLKLLLGLFIIIVILGLLIYSPQGRDFRIKYLDPYMGPVTGFFKGITGRLVKQQPVNRTLDITLETDFNALSGQNFDVQNFNLDVELDYDSATISDLVLKDSKTASFKATGMSGTIQMLGDNKMNIVGDAPSVEIGGIGFSPKPNKEKIAFSLVGTPISFSLGNIGKDQIEISGADGTVTVKDLGPLPLEGDKLTMQKFQGTISLSDDILKMTGKVERANLKGIDLSLEI